MTHEGPERDTLRPLQDSLGDRYQLTRELGRGGMAVVYLAEDRELDRSVALKVLLPDLVETTAADRFLREIRAVGRLQHPHIVPIFDSGTANGNLWYTMPYVEGETLREKILREGALPVEDCLRITREISGALTHAHEKGLVHRDIKPENILLSNGHALLADFGVARALEESGGETLTRTGITIGTPAYMSPEQASGSDKVDHRSDLYSLGCVLYETLVGEPPFSGASPQAIIAKHLQERPPSAEILRPTVPPPLSEAVQRSLAKVPADRFQTAEQMVEALQASFAVSTREWRQRKALRRVGLQGAILTAAITAAVIGVRTFFPATPSLDPNRVVVFPLVSTGEGGDPADGWNVALAIGTALEHTDPLRSEDGWLWLSEEMRDDPGLITQEVSRQIALERGAAQYVAGVIRGAGDSVAVTLRLHASDSDEILAQETSWGGADSALHDVGLSAMTRLLPHWLEPDVDPGLSALTTREPGAVALAIQGRRAYQESRFADALALYRRALEVDPMQPMAAARGAAAGVWMEREGEGALELARLAVAADSVLPVRYRHFAEGVEAYLSGRADDALVELDRALAEAPDWAEALAVKGEVFYHLFPSLEQAGDRSAGELFEFEPLAVSSLEAAVEANSTFTPPLVHLADVSIRAGDSRQAETWIERLRTAGGSEGRADRLDLALSCVSADGLESVSWNERAGADPRQVLAAGHALAAGGAQPECAAQAFRALIDQGVQAENPFSWGGMLGLQSILLAQGRLEETVALLDSALALGQADARTLYLFDSPLSSAFHAKADESERTARQYLGERYTGLSPVNIWLIGVWFAQQGVVDRVAEIAAVLDSISTSPGAAVGSTNGRSIRAVAALTAGQTEPGIEQLRALEPSSALWNFYWSLDEPRAIEKILLARELLREGDALGAHDVASQFDHPAPIAFLTYLAPSLEIRARAATALGRRELAREYRGRLSRLGWSDGEVPLSMEGPLLPLPPTEEVP